MDVPVHQVDSIETTPQSYFLMFDGMNTNWNVEFTVRPLLVPITLATFWHSRHICIFLALVAKVKFFLFVSPLCIWRTVLQINKRVCSIVWNWWNPLRHCFWVRGISGQLTRKWFHLDSSFWNCHALNVCITSLSRTLFRMSKILQISLTQQTQGT